MMRKKSKQNDIVKCCESRFGRGSATHWKHGEYVALSREIQNDTKVSISPNTLKRIFGKLTVDDDYLPQQATMDALETYGRYADRETATQRPVITRSNFKQRFSWIAGAAIVLVVIVAWFIWKRADRLPAHITLTKTEGLLPSTAYFELQVPESDDSLFVNFGDKSLLNYVNARQKRIAHVYLFPGAFQVTIQNRQHDTMATTKVSVRSDKWIGMGFRRQAELPEHYYEFPALKTGKDSLFHISNEQLYRMGLDTAGTFMTRLANYASTGYTADTFVFEATFRNELYEKGIYCNSTQFQITGINGRILFKFTNPGCSNRVVNVLSEQVFDSNGTDLSKFVLDLDKWNQVKLVNKDKHISVFANDKLIFKGNYQISLGEVKGVFLEFEGNGFVKSVNLKSATGKSLFHF